MRAGWFGGGIGNLVARVKGQDRRENKEPTLPPGSLGLPVLGETIAYARNPHKFFETRRAKFGPIFKTRLLDHNTVCFTSPEAFTFFVNQPSFLRNGANPGHIQELFCHESLPLIDGDEHKALRSVVMASVTEKATKTYLTVIETATLNHLKNGRS